MVISKGSTMKVVLTKGKSFTIIILTMFSNTKSG